MCICTLLPVFIPVFDINFYLSNSNVFNLICPYSSAYGKQPTVNKVIVLIMYIVKSHVERRPTRQGKKKKNNHIAVKKFENEVCIVYTLKLIFMNVLNRFYSNIDK